jgi:hypothetical protein
MNVLAMPRRCWQAVFLSCVWGAGAACSGGGGKAAPDGGMNDGGAGGAAGPSGAVSTATGVPVGQPMAQSIGPEGGTVVSADGKLTVTIPAGALATASPVSITAISNLAPGGIGSAYRLEPSGVTFGAPVELALAFTADDIAGGSADVLAWAFQDAMGFWHERVATVDTQASVLRVTTTHFSDWSAILGLSLRPASTSLRVGASLTVQVVSCESVAVDADGAALLGLCQPVGGGAVSGWSVNGVVRGNATVGTIAPQGAVAIYTAPGSKPSANPVRISVEAPAGQGRTILFSYVQITEGQIRWGFSTSFTPERQDESDAVFFSAEANGEFHGTAITGSGPGTTGTVMISRVPPRAAREGECTATVTPPAQLVILDAANTTTAIVLSDDAPVYAGTVVTFFSYEVTTNCPNQPPFVKAEIDSLTWLVIPQTPRNPDDLVLEGRFMDQGDTWTWTLRKSEE